MPTYQYQCTACGEGLEAVQKFTDEALTECPQCHGRLRKVFSAVGVVFKGSGFYRTDSRGSSSGGSDTSKAKDKTADKSAKSDSGSSGSSGGSGSSGSSGTSTASSSSGSSGSSGTSSSAA